MDEQEVAVGHAAQAGTRAAVVQGGDSRGAFARELAALQPRNAGERRWLYVPYDQLGDALGPLAHESPGKLGIVLVESRAKAARRPYHRQKLALVLANQRHFALEQARRGVAVRHLAGAAGFAEQLEAGTADLGVLRVMEPAERELRVELAPLVARGKLEMLAHEGWLTTREHFAASQGDGPPWRMDAFYRHVRRALGVLMEDGAPLGGRFSFDGENRRPWRGEPPAPEAPRFAPDAVTREVVELVERDFARHPGRVDARALPATRADAERMLAWAIEACLPHFGPYEDAFSERAGGLFHTRLSGLVNLHRLTPREVVDAVLDADLPLASKEGFVRQVLGWREFVRHVHRESDGFRALPGALANDDASPSFLGARAPLPAAWWDRPSGLRCLDLAVAQVWREAWTHHIPRLMVLSNLATLLDVSPRELTDWFWVAFSDAYDWVVEPNVLGMGTFAAGDVMTTKPYVCGAAYLAKMGDACGACRFDPRRDCPITPLYWDFLARRRERLADNQRLRMPLASQAKRSEAQRREDARVAERVRTLLAEGRELTPDNLRD